MKGKGDCETLSYVKGQIMNTEGRIPAQEDFDAVMASCLDFIEGWYTADVERMRRSLHPDLVKRTVARDAESGEWLLNRTATAQMMVGWTAEGGGTNVPEAERVYQITILDIFRHIAVVKCVAPDYVDYLQLAKIGGMGWVIVNDLWEKREGEITAQV